MSDDEEFWDGEDDEEDYFPIDDDDDILAPAPVPPVPVPAPPHTRARGPPLQQAQPNFFQQAQQMMHPGAFQAGFGGHAFARPPPSAFRKQYKAYSTAILEVQQGRSYGGGRSNLMYGGKIVMPPSALNELTQLDIELPIDYEITNPAIPDLNTHVGVLEFIADEGTVNLPQWVMDQLRLNEGDPIRIWGARFPKGKKIKIQPQSADFLEVSDPKAVLEQALRHFSCLSADDIIEIGYQNLQFRLRILEIDPPGPAIGLIDTDVTVEFEAPLGYVEPDYKKDQAPPPTMKDKFVIDTNRTQNVDARGSGSNTPVPGTDSPAGGTNWEAFKGSGASLGGKRIKGKGVSIRGIEAVDADSKIIRTDQPRIITADTQIGGRQVPAALVLPFGNLFFGYENLRPAPGSQAERDQQAAVAAAAAAPFASVTGSGNTLSGRARQGPAVPPPGASVTAVPRAAVPAAGPAVPFAGQGNSLRGGSSTPTGSSSGNKKNLKKKKIDVIEID